MAAAYHPAMRKDDSVPRVSAASPAEDGDNVQQQVRCCCSATAPSIQSLMLQPQCPVVKPVP